MSFLSCEAKNRIGKENQLLKLSLMLGWKLFDEVNRQLEKLGLKVEECKGAVVDATIIESAARQQGRLYRECAFDSGKRKRDGQP